jgi:methanogenic corrinoid protein MtbC1
MGKALSNEALHFLGIKVVYKAMVDEGFKILNVRRELGINPQILATKENKRYFVVVRTARYPDMGILLPDIAAEVLKHGDQHEAVCLFGSVGIANANGETEEAMAQPEKDGEYYINFKGLQPFPR